MWNIHKAVLAIVGLLSLVLVGVTIGVREARAQVPGPSLAPPPDPGGGAPPALGGPAAAGGAAEGDVQTRGPVHEAFAEPYDFNPKPSAVIPRNPPEPINEVPPDVKPDGDRMAWIPGYWAWDDDRQDFLWVSGLWRKLPPGRRWVPGYWVNQDGGVRWVSGSWVQEQAQEIQYLPAPPQSLEAGPNVAAPSDGFFWVPGSWRYVNNRYGWQAGYWSACYDNWVWVPARYVWTPRGVFFVRGYWDFAIADRGLLFAPTYFTPVVYRRPGFFFTPSVVVSLGGLHSNLFVGLNFGHYYFGDYYGDVYLRRGYTPWYACSGRGFYDPLLTFYVSDYRRHQHGDYIALMHTRHDDFVRHADLRPPRTFLAQQQWASKVTDAKRREAGELGRSLRDVGTRPDSRVKLVKVADKQRLEIEQSRKQIRELSTVRRQTEHVDAGAPGRAGGDRVRIGGPASGEGKADTAGKGTLKLPGAVGVDTKGRTSVGSGTTIRRGGTDGAKTGTGDSNVGTGSPPNAGGNAGGRKAGPVDSSGGNAGKRTIVPGGDTSSKAREPSDSRRKKVQDNSDSGPSNTPPVDRSPPRSQRDNTPPAPRDRSRDRSRSATPSRGPNVVDNGGGSDSTTAGFAPDASRSAGSVRSATGNAGPVKAGPVDNAGGNVGKRTIGSSGDAPSRARDSSDSRRKRAQDKSDSDSSNSQPSDRSRRPGRP